MGKLKDLCNKYYNGELSSYNEQLIFADIRNTLENLDTFSLRRVMIEFIKYFSISKPIALTRKMIIERILDKTLYGSLGIIGLINFISYLIDSEILEVDLEECIA